MADWIRFANQQGTGFGVVKDGIITVYTGNMFDAPSATDRQLSLTDVELLTPVVPRVMVGLWNNFYERAKKERLDHPKEPLYFFKPPSCLLAHGGTIRRPAGYDGKIVFEAELGVVIGRLCREVPEAQAADYVFGYTCINDVTAGPILREDPSFQQWCRAKGYDSFGPCGPHVRTGVNPDGLVVKALLNGREQQSYPVTDMIFPPLKLVSRISHFMTLQAGDIISCGTSLGAGPMQAGDRIEVVIDGVGALSNHLEV